MRLIKIEIHPFINGFDYQVDGMSGDARVVAPRRLRLRD